MPASPAVDGRTIGHLLESLVAALEESAPEPPTQALQALTPHAPEHLLAPVRACIADFDWPGATVHAHTLAAHFHHTLTR
jgi:hypothetical protein